LPVMALSDSPTVEKLAMWVITQLRDDSGPSDSASPMDATRAQIERLASQHAVNVPAATEIERLAAEVAANRRMIQ
jgi:phthiocerol/phenolphthiocerol synthesis type-I polyketide synthase C